MFNFFFLQLFPRFFLLIFISIDLVHTVSFLILIVDYELMCNFINLE